MVLEREAFPDVRPVGDGPNGDRRAPTLGEVVVGAAIVGFAIVSWSSLLLAHVRRHSFRGVVLLSLLLSAGAVAIALRHRVRVTVERSEIALLSVLALVAALMFLPGFSYSVGDKDPGAYTEHAVAIARTGSYVIADPVLDPQRVAQPQMWSPGARWPGLWVDDHDPKVVVPQFYHLLSATFATAYDVAGFRGISNVNPLAGILSVLALALLLRRVAGTVAAAAGGSLLATNMMQVWQAKYPTTEVMTQMLFLAMLLALAAAIQTRNRVAAGAAGVLLGVSYLLRPDGVLLVILAAALGGALVLVRRFDARAWWFAAGFTLVLPHALLQAYRYAWPYTRSNGVPALPIVAAVVAAPFVAALILRRTLPGLARWIDRVATGQALSAQRVIGGAVVAGSAALLALGFARPALFGRTTMLFMGKTIRLYNEDNVKRLSWFVTVPGMIAALLGLAVAALRRWRAALWVAVAPVVALLPVYLYKAQVAPRLMWWVRRYVPTALPGVVVLIAIAVGFAASRRGRWALPGRVAAVASAAFLLAVSLHQSLPLRTHREFGGSYQAVEKLRKIGGEKTGVFLFERPTSCCASIGILFGGPAWLTAGQTSMLLPPIADVDYVRGFSRGFAGRNVFLVTERDQTAKDYAELRPEVAERIEVAMPFWEEQTERRPDHARTIHIEMTVWRLHV